MCCAELCRPQLVCRDGAAIDETLFLGTSDLMGCGYLSERDIGVGILNYLPTLAPGGKSLLIVNAVKSPCCMQRAPCLNLR